jgi:hypothetical protein
MQVLEVLLHVVDAEATITMLRALDPARVSEDDWIVWGMAPTRFIEGEGGARLVLARLTAADAAIWTPVAPQVGVTILATCPHDGNAGAAAAAALWAARAAEAQALVATICPDVTTTDPETGIETTVTARDRLGVIA